jgi:hypothetical protein
MLEVATERMFIEPSILETIALVTLALRQYESAGGSAPLPRQRRQRRFLRSPRPARSRPRSCPRHHRRARARRRPFPSQQRQPNTQPLPQWPTRWRALSERRGHRRPVRSPLALMRFSCRASLPRPFRSALLPRTR